MNRIKKLFPYLTSVSIGIAIGLLLWSAAEFFFASLKNTDVKILVAIIAAFGSLTAGLIVAIVTHYSHKSRELLAQKRISDRELKVQEKISERELVLQKNIREREIEEAHRQKKVEIYNNFIKLVSTLIKSVNNVSKQPNQQKVLDELEKFQNGILLWGGPKVIQAYLEYRKNNDKDNLVLFRHIDLLYKALREDIGLNNEGLESLELVQIYLSNPEDIDTLLSKEA